MKTKILLGSIGAVVILVLASFTTVIGFQSSSSRQPENSPLFDYRTKKAIKATPETVLSNYVGRGSKFAVPLTPVNQKERIVIKFVESIIHMDDSSFDALVSDCVNHLVGDKKVKTSNIAEVISGLRSIRENPASFINQIADASKRDETNYEVRPQQYTMTGDWVPGCLLAMILYMVFVYPILVALVLISAYLDCLYSASTGCENCPCYRVPVSRLFSDLYLSN